MQKQVLAAITLLALLFGCGNPKEGNAAGLQKPNEVSADTPAPLPGKPFTADDRAAGERVYRSTCSICHRLGLKGAPRLGDGQDWKARLSQGKEVLYEHALKGYQGKKGFMPSRGSNAKLSEKEVKAAVDYMVWYSVPTSRGSFGSHMFSAAPKRSTIRQP